MILISRSVPKPLRLVRVAYSTPNPITHASHISFIRLMFAYLGKYPSWTPLFTT